LASSILGIEAEIVGSNLKAMPLLHFGEEDALRGENTIGGVR